MWATRQRRPGLASAPGSRLSAIPEGFSLPLYPLVSPTAIFLRGSEKKFFTTRKIFAFGET